MRNMEGRCKSALCLRGWKRMDEQTLRAWAKELGFAKATLCPSSAFEQAHRLVLRQAPLAERRQLRFDPGADDSRTRSLAVLLWPYAPSALTQGEALFVDSYYPASNAAYHAAKRLEERLTAAGCFARANVSYPAKEAAVRAGLGRIGRSSLLITPEYGTRVVIILMATDALCAGGDEPSERGTCLGCGRCVRACPTGAIDGGGMRHPERCLRNFMMEGVVVPEEVRPLMGMKLLGCDACQRACPMQTLTEAPQPVPLSLDELVTSDDAAFSEAVSRLAGQIGKNVARPQRVRAQAALLCGNRCRATDLPVLMGWAQSDAPAVREHARWAIARIRAQSGLDPSDKKR